MVCINDGAVNQAGKYVLEAWVLSQRGSRKKAEELISEARQLLAGEVMWAVPGRETVQQFLNHVSLLDLKELPLDSQAGAVGAEMVYFRSSAYAEIHKRPSTILERVA